VGLAAGTLTTIAFTSDVTNLENKVSKRCFFCDVDYIHDWVVVMVYLWRDAKGHTNYFGQWC
jgi:hypothetical protein